MAMVKATGVFCPYTEDSRTENLEPIASKVIAVDQITEVT
jgi:hypothetical protein